MAEAVFDFPDIEPVVVDMLALVGTVVTFLPDNADTLVDSGTPVILVERIGGTNDGVTDRAEVQVTCWADTRPRAWACARKARQIIDTYSYGGVVGSVFIDTTAVTDTAMQSASQDPDERRVIETYRFDTRRQHLAG